MTARDVVFGRRGGRWAPKDTRSGLSERWAVVDVSSVDVATVEAAFVGRVASYTVGPAGAVAVVYADPEVLSAWPVVELFDGDVDQASAEWRALELVEVGW